MVGKKENLLQIVHAYIDNKFITNLPVYADFSTMLTVSTVISYTVSTISSKNVARNMVTTISHMIIINN